MTLYNMIHVVVVCPRLSSFLTQLEEIWNLGTRLAFRSSIMLDDTWSKISVLAEPQKITFASNLLQLPFVVEVLKLERTVVKFPQIFMTGVLFSMGRHDDKSIATAAAVLYRARAGCTEAESDESSAAGAWVRGGARG